MNELALFKSIQMNSIISLFSSAMAQEPDAAISIAEFMAGIQSGRWASPVAVCRRHIATGDRVRYDHSKRTLPAVTISCHCLSREKGLTDDQKGVTHSGWLQADFDLKDNPLLDDAEVLAAMRISLLADPHVGAVFVGPSGEGIKAVVRIDSTHHLASWRAAESYFREKFQLKLDPSTKDPMRLCFVSHDPAAAMAEDSIALTVSETEPEPGRTWKPDVETTAADIEEMLSFIPARPDYDTWIKVSSAVWSVLPMQDGAALLNKWSPEEKPGEYAEKHKARLQQIGIGTLCMLAAQNGFDAAAAWRRKRWAGRIRFADGERSPNFNSGAGWEVPTQNIVVDISRERIMEAFNGGQAGDALLWCDMRAGLRVWNIHAKMWMIYSDGIWRRDSANETPWNICDTLCELYEGIIQSINQEISTNPAPDPKKDPREKELSGIHARCAKLRAWDYLSGVEKFARRKLHLPATAFDSNPDILVLENGTLDFSEGVFREHRPGDNATVRSPISFNPDAECIMWDAFLTRCLPNEETRNYLARAVGYSLTGRVHADALFFAYGKGANGKSTFYGVLKILLGDLMTTVPIAALLAAKSDNNFDYHKASMEGRRIVLTDEIPEGRSLADSQVKAITGGDPINARRPFEQPYTFMPTHKLWMMGNHKPDIKGTDEGIWRRVHMIPFLVTIPENERRPRHEVLSEFERESAGILNWAIRGLLESRDIGLCPPEQVVEATRLYREESDQFGSFLAECTEAIPSGLCGVGAIAKTYSAWCEQNGENPRYRGTRQVRKIMAERGWHIELDRKNHPTIFGLKLKFDDPESQLLLQS